ncbi:MAG: sulfite exporter TauE/SafE family protein [FCB group bacterium]|nr:sulfite exporter TauE/SafE family protein [FCB group bacterium]
MDIDLLVVFMLGLTGGFGHCIGMCGGFVLAYSVKLEKPTGRLNTLKLLAPHLLYSLGRTITYGFLGGLFGIIGLTFKLFNFQSYLQIFAGLIMLLLGAELAGWIPKFSNTKLPVFHPFRKLFSTVMDDISLTNCFVIGLILGFLPCGLVYAAVIRAIAADNIPTAILTMMAFGLGTIPALLLVGLGANMITARFRKYLFRMSAVLVIALGVITLYKGWVKMQMPAEKLQHKLEMNQAPDCCGKGKAGK